MPPNSCFTTIIAKALPIIAIHHGAVGGRLSANISPVTAADKSFTLTGRFASFCHTNSASTAEATETATINAEFKPNRYIPAAVVGSSAISTSRIIVFTESLHLICGAVDIVRFISSPLSCLSYFFFCYLKRSRKESS